VACVERYQRAWAKSVKPIVRQNLLEVAEILPPLEIVVRKFELDHAQVAEEGFGPGKHFQLETFDIYFEIAWFVIPMPEKIIERRHLNPDGP
jgi:hypothetical protein